MDSYKTNIDKLKSFAVGKLDICPDELKKNLRDMIGHNLYDFIIGGGCIHTELQSDLKYLFDHISPMAERDILLLEDLLDASDDLERMSRRFKRISDRLRELKKNP